MPRSLELKHYLTHEWRRCKIGSVLYLATHGDQGEVYLSEDEPLGLDTLAGLLDEGQCQDRLVHFSGCSVLGGDEDVVRQRVKTFMGKTGAMGVSGYAAEAGWTDTWAPAGALELMLFSSIQSQGIDLSNGKHFKALSKVVALLQGKFADCQFDLYTRLDARIRR